MVRFIYIILSFEFDNKLIILILETTVKKIFQKVELVI